MTIRAGACGGKDFFAACTSYCGRRDPGVRVSTAADGMEACIRPPTLRPAVIMVDLIMPRMDGWRLIEVVRAHADYADTRFIIVSGQGSNESVDRAHALGIPYATKLGDLNALVALVGEQLAKYQTPGVSSHGRH